jgi:IclR-like helix-turn-helix domain-containing protein
MAGWTFLTYHARVLLCVAHDPGVRLRDIAASLNITERSAFGIITDLVEAGYVVKEKNGRRNRYHIQAHLPLPEPDGRERTVGEILALLTGTDAPATARAAMEQAAQAGTRTPALPAAITTAATPGRTPAGTTPDSIQLSTWEREGGQHGASSQRAATSAAS